MKIELKNFMIVLMAAFLLFSVNGCGKNGGWWGQGAAGGPGGQEAAGPGAAGGPAPAVEPAPVPGGEPQPGAGPGAGQEPVPVAEDEAGPAAGEEPGAQPAPGQQNLPELQATDLAFFPEGSDRSVGRSPVNTAGQLRVSITNAGNADAMGVECYVQLDNGAKDFFNFDNIPAHREVTVNRPFKLNVPVGRHTVRCSINEGGAVIESDSADERNNKFEYFIEVIPAEQPQQEDLPDLQAVKVRFAPVGTSGDEDLGRVPVNTRGWITGLVKNVGRTDVRNVPMYLQIDDGDKYRRDIENIRADHVAGFSKSVVLDRPGKHILRVVTNHENTIRESDGGPNDANNELTQIILVDEPAPIAEGLPELQAVSITFTPVGTHESVNRVPVNTRGWLHGQVRNAGRADGRNVFGYLQVDGGEKYWFIMPLIPTGDIHAMGGYAHVIDLNDPGQRLLRLHINPTHTIPESDGIEEDRNNELIQKIDVTGGVQAARQALSIACDLVAEDVVFCVAPGDEPISMAYVGESGHLSYMVRNKTGAVKDAAVWITMTCKDGTKLSQQGSIDIPESGVFTGTTSEVTLTSAGPHEMSVIVDHPDNSRESLKQRANECTRPLDVRRRPRRKAVRQDDYSASAMYNTLVGSFVQTGVSSGRTTAPAPTPAASNPAPYTTTGPSTTSPAQKSVTPATYKTRAPLLKTK